MGRDEVASGGRRARLAIAIPTYNEAASLPLLLGHLDEALGQAVGVEAVVLIVDDASPDGTGLIAEGEAEARSRPGLAIQVLHRGAKEGLGRAYTEGLSLLLTTDVDYVVQMDADLSHDPRHLPAFIDAAGRADLVVGSRYVSGGATPDWPAFRRLLSRAGNLYARAWLGSEITDYTGGYNLFSAELLRGIGVERLRSDGYGFLIELKYAALRAGGAPEQIPIVFHERRAGRSKIPRRTILTNLILVPTIRFVGSRRRR